MEERYKKAIRFLTLVTVGAIVWAFVATIKLIDARHDARPDVQAVRISSAAVSL